MTFLDASEENKNVVQEDSIPTVDDGNCNDDYDDDENDECNSDCDSTDLRRRALIDYLRNDLGWAKNCETTAGGKVSSSRIRTNASRVVDIVLELWKNLDPNAVSFQNAEILPLLEVLMNVRSHSFLIDYCINLERSKKPTTINHYLETFKKAIRWFTCFKRPTLSGKSEEFCKRVDMLKKPYMKQALRQRKANKTIAQAVHLRQQPPNGLADIQDAVLKAIMGLNEEFKERPEQRNSWQDEKHIYNYFMGLMQSSLYAFSAQGRVGGISHLTLGKYCELIDGHALSDEFKTASTYVYQPVTTSNISKVILKLYVGFVRPRTLLNSEDPLFLKQDGTPMDSQTMGSLVKHFFFKTIGDYNITTNSLRSMVETAMARMVEQNKLSSAHKDAVHSINGHSGEVAHNYYIMRNFDRAVATSNEAFQILHDENVSGQIGNQNEVLALQVDEDLQEFINDLDGDLFPQPASSRQWGSDHPEGSIMREPSGVSRPCNKYIWSDEELNYMKSWAENNTNELQNRCARCLKYIMNDPSAIPIFHPHHIVNSARLQAGFDRAVRNASRTKR